MKATDVEIERRCGMVTGASCGNVTLSWIPEYTAKLLGVPLDEVLYIIAHPETPAPHKDDFTPEFIEPLI